MAHYGSGYRTLITGGMGWVTEQGNKTSPYKIDPYRDNSYAVLRRPPARRARTNSRT